MKRFRNEKEKGTVSIRLKDGTWKMLRGKNLALHLRYINGVPHLMVRKSLNKEDAAHGKEAKPQT